MAWCGKAPTKRVPWFQHAELLQATEHSEDLPALEFPMYSVPVEDIFKMTEVRPHETLLAEDILVEFDDSMGNVSFVSHQWVGGNHPDPDFKQFPVLQGALKNILMDHMQVDLSIMSGVTFSAQIDNDEFRKKPLFIWYDYFCCPQLEHKTTKYEELPGQSNLTKAINSIPQYVARSAFFFVLCPVIDARDGSRLFTPDTWRRRGWCRVEQKMQELAHHAVGSIWIKSTTHVELSVGAYQICTLGHSEGPGDGEFTVDSDREKLAEVFQQMLWQKLRDYVRKGDILNYRALLNFQSVHLRGLPAKPVVDIIPGFEAEEALQADPKNLKVEQFLYQNGFKKISEIDANGMSPVCYAAIRGDPVLMQGLLERRADPNDRSRKNHHLWQKDISVVTFATSFKNNDTMRLLLHMRADPDAGFYSAMTMASYCNNHTAIRYLCQHGVNPQEPNRWGQTMLMCASASAAYDAVEEHLKHKVSLSIALSECMSYHGGTTDMVDTLVAAKADVNEQYMRTPCMAAAAVVLSYTLQHHFGRRRAVTRWCYHLFGSTPLMIAVITGNWEGAAALIAHGARVDIKNSRRYTALDLARETPVPDFLMAALEGNPEPCYRIAEMSRQIHSERF